MNYEILFTFKYYWSCMFENISSQKPISLLYLSHGETITGGYLHEKYLAQTLAETLQIQYTENRFWEYFEHPLAHLKLNWKAFIQSKSDIVISVARLSIPVLLRNLFNQNKILLVWHYHDNKDGLGWLLHAWYSLSLSLIKFLPSSKVKLICVAPYWQKYFTKKVGQDKVVMFPNLFNPTFYSQFKSETKLNEIHLGQVSFKNSQDLLWLTANLKKQGYTCFFSTNNPKLKLKTIDNNAEIRYFGVQEEYFKAVAMSKFTLALPSFNEGWNRMAHESLLLGTPVIAYAKGGLSDLLNLAQITAAKNKEEVLLYILNNTNSFNLNGLSAYEDSNKHIWENLILKWLK